MTLPQLEFDFTPPLYCPGNAHRHVSWREKQLARKHRIPLSQATVYAAEMGLPTGEHLS
jgi:hypothetical protein